MRVWLRDFSYGLLGSPKRDRLEDFIAAVWQEMGGRPASTSGIEPWKLDVYNLLDAAEKDIENWQLEHAWGAVVRAHRALLKGKNDKGQIERVAISLNHEREKVKGWRAGAIKELLCDRRGNLLTGKTLEVDRVIDALAHRDDYYQNDWHKIELRRTHLVSLFAVLLLGVLATIILSAARVLPSLLCDWRLVVMVILLGVLGAGLSVAQALLSRGLSDKIPEQYLGAFVIWMRPVIGAVAALAIFVLLKANEEPQFFTVKATDPVIAIFAFVAGYSERFIVGALGKVSDTVATEKKG